MSRRALALAFVLLVAALLVPFPLGTAEASDREVHVEAISLGYDPAIIRVSRGQRVSITLSSLDVTHGLYVDGYAVRTEAQPGQEGRVSFVADRPGKFRFRCSVACGSLHPFMVGELIVEPNHLFPRSMALVVAATLGMVGYLGTTGQQDRGAKPGRRIEFTRLPWVKRLLRQRWLQPALMLPLLFGFVLMILAGFVSTPIGSKNAAIIFVWIVWWALLILVLLPFTGRLWCAACPIPAPGEWLQRRGIVVKRQGRPLTLGIKWPRSLDNIWLQNLAFLGVALFSGVILTQPWATSAALLGFILLATASGLIFERRVFCRYLCPVGGFIGLYAMLAPVELRVIDRETCENHRGKECYLGSDQGHGCPWRIRPWRMQRNAYCGLCTECIKTCPKDNVAIQTRPFGTDLFVADERGLDEAFKLLIMLTCALLYSAVFLGPWGWLKAWAGTSGGWDRVSYAAAFLAVNLLLAPGLLLLATWVSRALGGQRGLALSRLFRDNAYALIPMGLSAWMAFSLSFVLVNGSYVIPLLSDPFGWGWNLLGTRDLAWAPILTQAIPYLQVAVLIGGLLFSIKTAYAIGLQHNAERRRRISSLLPMAGLLAGATAIFLKLYLA